MRSVFGRRLVHVVAMLLLLWTATDLTSPSLCALDNEGASQTTSGDDLSAQAGSSPAGPRPALPPHIDDCFCCSHCVDVPAMTRELHTSIVDLAHEPLVSRKFHNAGVRLYHPPLA